MRPRARTKEVPNRALFMISSIGFPDDEIHRGLRILRSDRKMALALSDDHREISAECLVILFRDPRLAVEPRIEAAAHVQDRHPSLGHRLQFVRQAAIALLARHDAAPEGILPANAG